MIVTNKSLYWIRSQLAGWWKSLPAFTGKTQTQRKRHHRVSPAHSTGRQSWLRSPGWSWTDQAGRSSGSSTRAPRWPDHHRLADTGRQGRHQTLNAPPGSFGELHRLPSQAVRRQIIQTKQGQTFGLGLKRDNLYCTVGFTEQEV